ncbi:MAG: HTH domain-containing protein [Bacteroidota bacterium]|nr:HTH domain-containing protein [Bacteroidota bacterium]
MKFNQYNEKLELIKKLIRFQNTGTPSELASTLKISERTLRRLMAELKEQKFPVVYSRSSKTYLLKE